MSSSNVQVAQVGEVLEKIDNPLFKSFTFQFFLILVSLPHLIFLIMADSLSKCEWVKNK